MVNWLSRLIARIRSWLGISPHPLGHTPPPSVLGTTGDEAVFTSSVRILGTRNSGKTTYLAALLRNTNGYYDRDPIKLISPIGLDTLAAELKDQAINILEAGADFEETLLPLNQQVREIGVNIEIAVPSRRGEKVITLSLFTKDISGEFLSSFRILDDAIRTSHLRDCAKSEGLMLMVDGTNIDEDYDLEITLQQFLPRLEQSAGVDGWKGRIAFVVSKCEQSRLYLKRKELGNDKEFVGRLFPRSVGTLTALCPRRATVAYFSLSSFGILGGRCPEPNVKMVSEDQGDSRAAIRNTMVWRPFGLEAPLYWLCTGQYHPKL